MPADPIPQIVAAFRTHNVVTISDPHGNVQVQAFILSLVRDYRFREVVDAIVIETSGLALPLPLLKAFAWRSVRTRATVDGVVTVVDALALSEGRVTLDEDALVDQRAAPQIGKRECGLAVAAIGRAEQGEQRVVLRDRLQRAIAKSPTERREIPGERADFSDVVLGHGSVLLATGTVASTSWVFNGGVLRHHPDCRVMVSVAAGGAPRSDRAARTPAMPACQAPARPRVVAEVVVSEAVVGAARRMRGRG